jgi:hypothetical protein
MDLLVGCLMQLRGYPGLESLKQIKSIEPRVVHIAQDDITLVWTWRTPKRNIPPDYEYSASSYLKIVFFANQNESFWTISNDFCSNLLVPQERMFDILPHIAGSIDEDEMRRVSSAILKDLPYDRREVKTYW